MPLPTFVRSRVSFATPFLLLFALCAPALVTSPVAASARPAQARDAREKQERAGEGPCAELPPGRAEGLKRRCEEAASSNGVARGDFNGDGFADLAVGVPFEDLTVDGDVRTDAGAVNIIYGSSTGLSATGPVPAQFFSQTSTGVPEVSEDGDNFGKSLASGDFNGDGFSDLAVGIPNEDYIIMNPYFIHEVRDAGAVVVIFGSASGLDPDGALDAQLLTEQTFFPHSYRCFNGDSECFSSNDINDYDRFGTSLAWGDFNDDGIGDLAVGAPNQDYEFRSRFSNGDVAGFAGTEVTNAGAVFVFRGRTTGLDDSQLIFAPEITRGSELNDGNDGDNFGAALAGGNFDRTGGDDLAVGVPGDQAPTGSSGRPSSLTDEGSVAILFGRACGSGSSRLQTRESSCVAPQRLAGGQANLRLGSVLAAGDFRGVGRDDLAAGVPRRGVSSHTLGFQSDAGSVFVYRMQDGRMILGQTINQSLQTPLAGGPEAGDRFGSALAVGDFNGDGFKDLAVGAPFEDVTADPTTNTTFLDIGGAQVLFGEPRGLLRVFVVNTLAREPQSDALYGFTLTAWDFGLNTDSTLRPTADLAVGIPGKNVGTIRAAGEVLVIYGRGDGSFDSRTDFWNQDSSGIPGGAEANDRFGYSIY